MSTDTTPTPGPWQIERVERLNGSIEYRIVTDDFGVIANVEPTDSGDEELPNARRMAAAPDLLAACELFTAAAHECVALLNSKGYACPSSIAFAAEQARHAIAKAIGRYPDAPTTARPVNRG